MRANFQRLMCGLLLVTGCQDVQVPDESTTETHSSSELAIDFDAAQTGTISGRVEWQGEVPQPPDFHVYASRDAQPDMPGRGTKPNPHAPRIDAASKGVGAAVVFLKSVDLRKSRPWKHEPVRLEMADWQLYASPVSQRRTATSITFVRRGDTIDLINLQKKFHIVRAQGAATFSLLFPKPDVVTRRTLNRTGHVELTSGSGYFWLRGHLFVDDHPYYALTDSRGDFSLEQVPAGTYEIVCWLPNWNVATHERDPESSQIMRIHFKEPLVSRSSIEVRSGATSKLKFTMSSPD